MTVILRNFDSLMFFNKSPINKDETDVKKLQHSMMRLKNFVSARRENLKATKLSLLFAMGGIAFVLLIVVASYGFMRGLSFNLPEMIVHNVTTVFGKDLKTDSLGHTNIMIVGVGGEKHDGPNLTDTIILASINQKNDSIGLLSIPRDLYVEAPKVGATKINGVYDLLLKKNHKDPLIPYTIEEQTAAMDGLKGLVENITGTEIGYYTKVDFTAFKEIVDHVGGVEVNVPENFLDRQYPNQTETGYETFFLKKGEQTLDGITALKYARSRHSTSDFDRASRQHIIIKALLTKMLQKETLMNPAALRRIYLSVSNNVTTDLDWREILKIADFATVLKPDSIASVVLHDDPSRTGGLLYSPNRAYFNGAAVLMAAGAAPAYPNDFKQIQLFANMYFSNSSFFTHPPRVLVLNGTDEAGKRAPGVANEMKRFLQKNGMSLVHVGDTPKLYTADSTMTYYFSDSQKKEYEDAMSLLLPGQQLVFAPASDTIIDKANASADIESMLQDASDEYDVIVIIGNDYDNYLESPTS